jgi:ketosteroid isomerase-like protein
VSVENVELLRRSNAAFRRGDFEAWGGNFDADILVRTDPIWPEQRMYGRAAVVAWGASMWETLGPDVRLETIDDLGDRVLARARWITHGQHSGIDAELLWSELLTVRDGRFILIEMFLDHADALEAVGLAD